MANFPTHVMGATVSGVIASTVLGATGLISPLEIATGIAIVILGGIFPDIDSDRSDSIALIFNVFAVWIGAALAIAALPQAGLLGSLGILVVMYLLIRFVSIEPFRKLTSHRGIFHSTPMALLLMFLITLLCYNVFDLPADKAWIFSGLFFIGFMTHLILDECYSVDLSNVEIKRSFGTAIKLFNSKHWIHYALLYVLVGIAAYYSPSPDSLTEKLADIEFKLFPSKELQEQLKQIAMLTPRS